MPVKVATGLYVAFILFLLQRSSKSEPRLSLGLWVPTIWIGVMLSKPLAYWFEPVSRRGDELQSYLDGNPIDRNVLIFLIVAGLIILLPRRVNWTTVFRQYPVIWMFYAYAFLSMAWSPYPFVIIKRVFRELGDVVMILVILTEPHPFDAVRRVFVRCTLVLVPLSVLFIKYYPEIGRYYNTWTWEVAYAGVTSNKNSLGLLAMVGGLFLLWHIAESGQSQTRWQRLVSAWPEAGVFVMCLWILNIANSATALVSFVLGVLVFIAGRTILSGASVRTTVWAVAAAVLAGIVVLSISDLRGLFTQGIGRHSDLTERTTIWAAALALPTNPVIGAGFSSVWLTPEGRAVSRDLAHGSLAHSHNGYLETYLNGGLVGLALLIGILFLAAVQAGRNLSEKTPAGAFYVAFVLAGVVYNFTEVTFNYGNALGLLLWLIAFSAPALVLVRRDVPQLDRLRRPRSAGPVREILHAPTPASRPTIRNGRYIRGLNRYSHRG